LAARPEALAWEHIDATLAQAGWLVQDADVTDLSAGRGIAVREFPLARGHGKTDCLSKLTARRREPLKRSAKTPRSQESRARRRAPTSSGAGTRDWRTPRVSPAPDVTAAEIVKELRTAFEQFEAIQVDISARR
jgi:hypothetical protein